MSVLQTSVDDRAVWVRFNRPEKRNALNVEVSHALDALLTEHHGTELPLVIGSSTPGMFVGGSDVASLRTRTLDDSLSRLNSNLFQRLEDHPWPTIAVVDGAALGGGCELTLACDFRIASDRSIWGLPEVRLGLVPSAGGLWRLPRLVGWGAAVDLITTGRRIDATEAHGLGLVSRLVQPDDLDDTVDELLTELGRASSTAVRIAKEAMRATPDHRRLVDALAQAVSLSGEDAQQRLDAFLSR
jgi:enoyl-CoA hydratase